VEGEGEGEGEERRRGGGKRKEGCTSNSITFTLFFEEIFEEMR